MQYNIHATGLQLTLAIKEAAVEKFGRLERILGAMNKKGEILLDIELARTTHHHHKGKIFRAELHIPMGRKSVYAASESDDLYDAIDHCVAAIKRQLLKIKEKGA